MAHNDSIPYSLGTQAFKTGFDDEIVNFFVDFEEVSLLETFSACKLVFRVDNSLSSEALGEIIGTIEDREDPDDNVVKKAAVSIFNDELKKSILGDLKTRFVFVALVLTGGSGSDESKPLWYASAQVIGVA